MKCINHINEDIYIKSRYENEDKFAADLKNIEDLKTMKQRTDYVKKNIESKNQQVWIQFIEDIWLWKLIC